MKVVIVGAGGHAKVVLDSLLSSDQQVLGFIDDDLSLQGQSLLSYPILGQINRYDLFIHSHKFIMGIGSNKIRETLAHKMSNVNWTHSVHSTAYVARATQLGMGSALIAKSVVNPGTIIGNHVIINTGATIDHDCVIGDFVHIAPGVNIAANVHIGKRVFVGIGATIINGSPSNPITIADDVVIGAGAVVTKSITEPGITVVGVPAKPLNPLYSGLFVSV